MVDRISKVSSPDHIRVDESKDATEDEGRQGGGGVEEGDEEEGLSSSRDGFDRLRDKTDWNVLLEHPRSQQKRVEVAVDDVAELKFLHINLKTNPSLINLKVKLKDGTVFSSAYFSIARHAAVPFQNSRYDSEVDPSDLTEGQVLTFFVPDVRSDFADEVTRVEPAERTFSQTIKLLVKKTLLQKIGVQDPETRHANPEIVWAYVTAAVVAASLAFAAWWILR